MTWIHGILLVGVLGAFIVHYECSCSYPADLEGTWYASDIGEVYFNSSHMETTHSVAIFGQQTFECFENIDNLYLSVSSVFTYLNSNFRLAFCWYLERQSSTKYIYYAALDVLPNTTNTRVMFKLNGYSYSIGADCISTSPYDPWHDRVMVKTGSVDSAEIICPDYILGYFHYTFTSSSGSFCTSSSSVEACSDISVILYDYSQCSTIQAYSAGGRLSCVHQSTSGDNVYLIAYNRDATTDESTYYRYTCFMISQDPNDTSIRHMTQSPQACMANQTSKLYTSPGAYLRLSGNNTCVPVVTTESSSSTSTETILSAGTMIAIIVIMSIVMATVFIVGGFWVHKKWKAKHISPEIIEKLPKVEKFDRMGSFVSETSLVSCYSPYPTVSEIAFTRYGPSPIPDDDDGMSLSDSEFEYTYNSNPRNKPVPNDRYHDFTDKNEVFNKAESNWESVPEKHEEKFLYEQKDDSLFVGIEPIKDDRGHFSFRPITKNTDTDASLPSSSEDGADSPDISRLTNVEEESTVGSLADDGNHPTRPVTGIVHSRKPAAVRLPAIDSMPIDEIEEDLNPSVINGGDSDSMQQNNGIILHS